MIVPNPEGNRWIRGVPEKLTRGKVMSGTVLGYPRPLAGFVPTLPGMNGKNWRATLALKLLIFVAPKKCVSEIAPLWLA